MRDLDLKALRAVAEKLSLMNLSPVLRVSDHAWYLGKINNHTAEPLCARVEIDHIISACKALPALLDRISELEEALTEAVELKCPHKWTQEEIDTANVQAKALLEALDSKGGGEI
jgi:hypothetical protein